MKSFVTELLTSANCKKSGGFTLIEIMLTLMIGSVIMAAIYSAYLSQQKTYISQEQVVDMQQNIRAGLEMLTSELRMAGYNPGGDVPDDEIGLLGSGGYTTNFRRVTFAKDDNDDVNSKATGAVTFDGDTDDVNERLSYFVEGVDANNDGAVDNVDPNGDGLINDANNLNLIRKRENAAGANEDVVAENIQAIEFFIPA